MATCLAVVPVGQSVGDAGTVSRSGEMGVEKGVVGGPYLLRFFPPLSVGRRSWMYRIRIDISYTSTCGAAMVGAWVL